MQRLRLTMRTLDVLRPTIGGGLLTAFVGTLMMVQPPLSSTPPRRWTPRRRYLPRALVVQSLRASL